MRRALHFVPVVAIWAAAATALALPARRVVDWFVMTDELLYERLAFSVARTGSPLPTLHGEHVPVANQLYPVILGAFAGNDLVPSFLTRAHTVNAVLMTSAAVPAYLLARSLLRTHAGAYASALLAVVVPWLVLSSFVLSEAAAYPAFVWAVYLTHRAVVRPSTGADALALLGLVVAFLARTQFIVLFAAALIGALFFGRRSFARHRLLVGAIVALAVVALILALAGHSVFGTYSATAHGSLLGTSTPRSLLEHAATLALALGLLPPVLGAAWLCSRRSGAVAATAVVLVILEVTSFDLRFGGALPRDRYLFYAAPLLLIGFVGALEERELPRTALVAPLAIVVVGLALSPLPVFEKLNVDTPAAILDDYIHRNGGWAMLVAAILLLVAIVYLAWAFVPRRIVAVVLVGATAAALTAETAYAFDRLLRVDGTSGRPITVTQGGVFDWIDRTVGPDASVTMIPYAQIAGDYWATAGYWWDLEFWNRSVTRAAYPGNRFAEIQSTFPKLDLRFDPRTGAANASPTRYVAESDLETRFRVRGTTLTLTRDVRLIDAGRSWRADWTTTGLDDDGFTVPGRTATIRVYPEAGQAKPLERYVTVHVIAASAQLGVRIDKATTELQPNTDADVQAAVCVPPHGVGVVRMVAHGSTKVHGDLGSRAGLQQTRVRGVQVDRISLADETAGC